MASRKRAYPCTTRLGTWKARIMDRRACTVCRESNSRHCCCHSTTICHRRLGLKRSDFTMYFFHCPRSRNIISTLGLREGSGLLHWPTSPIGCYRTIHSIWLLCQKWIVKLFHSYILIFYTGFLKWSLKLKPIILGCSEGFPLLSGGSVGSILTAASILPLKPQLDRTHCHTMCEDLCDG